MSPQLISPFMSAQLILASLSSKTMPLSAFKLFLKLFSPSSPSYILEAGVPFYFCMHICWLSLNSDILLLVSAFTLYYFFNIFHSPLLSFFSFIFSDCCDIINNCTHSISNIPIIHITEPRSINHILKPILRKHSFAYGPTHSLYQ